MRTCKSFKNIEAIKISFYAFVKSKIEYCSNVYFPTQKGTIALIEKVLWVFIKFLSYKIIGEFPRRGTPNDELLAITSFDTFGLTRKCLMALFCIKLIKKIVDCQELYLGLPPLAPFGTSRRYQPLYPPLCRNNSEAMSPINLMIKNVNWIYEETGGTIDFVGIVDENIKLWRLLNLVKGRFDDNETN